MNKIQKEKLLLTIQTKTLKGYTPFEIASYLNDSGFPNHKKNKDGTYKVWTGKQIKGYQKQLQEQWIIESENEIRSHRARQLTEIQLIKKNLHDREDYRTLHSYIKTESELLGTSAPRESSSHNTFEYNITVEQRVAALQAASNTEQALLETDNEVIEGIIIREPVRENVADD